LGICPIAGDNSRKLELIPHTPYGGKRGTLRSLALLDEPKSD
jgi:hypothetical protein